MKKKNRQTKSFAETKRPDVLKEAKKAAITIAKIKGEVTADDVQAALVKFSYPPGELGNAAGSIFRGKHWRWTGKLKASERESRHGNMIKVWRYVG